MNRTTFICGGDETPGPRGTTCDNVFHNYPLPSGYTDASEVAARRLRRGWKNPRCPDCGIYGWIPSLRDADTPEVTRMNHYTFMSRLLKPTYVWRMAATQSGRKDYMGKGARTRMERAQAEIDDLVLERAEEIRRERAD